MSEEEKKPEEKVSVNPLLDEVRAERERLEKIREEAKKEADRLEQLQSNQMLSGTAGIRPPIEPAKEETAKEYSDRIMSGKVPTKQND